MVGAVRACAGRHASSRRGNSCASSSRRRGKGAAGGGGWGARACCQGECLPFGRRARAVHQSSSSSGGASAPGRQRQHQVVNRASTLIWLAPCTAWRAAGRGAEGRPGRPLALGRARTTNNSSSQRSSGIAAGRRCCCVVASRSNRQANRREQHTLLGVPLASSAPRHDCCCGRIMPPISKQGHVKKKTTW